MPPPDLDSIRDFVERHIGDFHATRLKSLDGLKLKQILARKNPYLYRAKNVLTAGQLVRGVMDAHLSSQEETLFGEFLESLAIFINAQVFGGRKSSVEGIDLEFEREGIRWLVSIKSGPNWGNSNQIARMRDNFKKAIRTARTGKSKLDVRPVNGCCYGQESKPDKGDYHKLCGQEFWSFVSGSDTLYVDIIEPLGHRAKQRNDEFEAAYATVVNRFTRDFLEDFCTDGAIDWVKLVRYNSESKAAPHEWF
jgi:hypothetical protein